MDKIAAETAAIQSAPDISASSSQANDSGDLTVDDRAGVLHLRAPLEAPLDAGDFGDLEALLLASPLEINRITVHYGRHRYRRSRRPRDIR